MIQPIKTVVCSLIQFHTFHLSNGGLVSYSILIVFALGFGGVQERMKHATFIEVSVFVFKFKSQMIFSSCWKYLLI